jgi:hypothetical protein
MVGQRQHASLENDAETNQAAWEAAKGAAWGGSKVSYTFPCLSCEFPSVPVSLHPSLVKKLLLSIIWNSLKMSFELVTSCEVVPHDGCLDSMREVLRTKLSFTNTHYFILLKLHTDMR